MTNAYQLKPWTQVVTPHDDILEGNLDSSTYAASLGSVVRGDDTCPRVYRDAREFFKATYMTKELRSLLAGVLRGLNGEKGDRVLQLRTPFGGGKTYSLVSLYHLVENRDKLQDFPELATLPNPGKVETVAFIGLDVGASTGVEVEPGKRVLTPWGYMAWQIGGAEAYALVETEDQQRIAPGNDVLRTIFGNDPVLLLLDEFLVYVESAMALPVGDSTFGRQVLTFIQKLTEVVRELPKTVLVYSLQASIQESFGNDGTLVMLDKLVSRIDAKKEPVAGDEVMKIIQRRLFADIGDSTIIEEVAYQQAELYRKFYESYEDTSRGKQQVQQQADLLAERIKLSYPFHPDLLDLMYYRWGSLPSYQRTRGALQFLARVVYALRNTQDTSLLITPANIPFQDEGVRGAFFSQVGERERFISVIDADIVGRKAKVKAVDNRIATDSPALSLVKVGTRVASAILMYSFGAKGGQDRGVLEQEVTSACLAPNLNRNIITATLSDLREELLYLHYVGKRYRFETKANLNKLIADEESKIAVDEVLDLVRLALTKSLSNTRGKVVLWAKDSSAIRDRISEFSVLYLSPEWAEKSREAVKEEALNWLEYRGNDKRDYKNALAFVIPSKSQIDKARKGARTVLAVTSLIEQKAKYKFVTEDVEELKTKVKDAKQQIEAALRRLYEYILLPLPDNNGTNPIRLELVDLQSQLNTSQNLQDRVLEALSNYLFDSIKPAKLLQYSGLENLETEYIKAEELVSYFFRFPTLPKMLDTKGIKTAILKAIEKGLLGYVPSLTIETDSNPTVENPSLISFERKIPEEELDLSGYLLSPSLVNQLQLSATNENNPEIDLVEQRSSSARMDSGDLEPEPYTYPEDNGSKGNTTVVSEDKKNVEYKTDESSSLVRTVAVDVIEGKKPAHSYKLNTKVEKKQIFDLFGVLQTLSDNADTMTIQIEVRAQTTKEFDRNWISNAIEEPLDELNIEASTKLE